eukprot:TRINITY_DN2378_c0_g3_i1.p1 TRINITY_DN2378_c0_g3~~TRINITY_DN2378_c0_g3_i1.p1  ORF type:complete len:100 (-),score=23.86 TRINITY_DN2378_c0_g3_i1:78-377(-)
MRFSFNFAKGVSSFVGSRMMNAHTPRFYKQSIPMLFAMNKPAMLQTHFKSLLVLFNSGVLLEYANLSSSSLAELLADIETMLGRISTTVGRMDTWKEIC